VLDNSGRNINLVQVRCIDIGPLNREVYYERGFVCLFFLFFFKKVAKD